MKAATNIAELYQVLAPGALTKEDSSFYVEIYDDQLKIIRKQLELSPIESQSIYVAGQSGTGKTTALNFLPNDDLEKHFEVVHIYCDDLLDVGDVNIIEFLLTLCFELVKDHTALKDIFERELEKIKKIVEGREIRQIESKVGSNVEGGGGMRAKFGNDFARFLSLFRMDADFFINLKLNNEYRELVRSVLTYQKRDLFELTNRIIHKYEELITDKPLLLVINELDHMKNIEQIDKLFRSDKQWIRGLKCRKVISVPIMVLTRGIEMDCYFFGLKLRANPLDNISQEASQAAADQNVAFLKKIVKDRIAADTDLITDTALEKAVQLSGGIIRQYFDILKEAALRMILTVGENGQLSENDIEEGSKKMQQNLSLSILSTAKIEALEAVRTQFEPAGNKDIDFQELLLSNKVLIYKNTPNWYELNPLIARTVEIYANKPK